MSQNYSLSKINYSKFNLIIHNFLIKVKLILIHETWKKFLLISNTRNIKGFLSFKIGEESLRWS